MKNYHLIVIFIYFLILTSCASCFQNECETYKPYEDGTTLFVKGFTCVSSYNQREYINCGNDEVYELIDNSSGVLYDSLEYDKKGNVEDYDDLIKGYSKIYDEYVDEMYVVYDTPQYSTIGDEKNCKKHVDRRMSLKGLEIQDLFEPREFLLWMEGDLYPRKWYPFGEIVPLYEPGRASFVVFIYYNTRFDVIKHDINILRVSRELVLSEHSFTIMFEVRQIENIKIACAIDKIKEETGFYMHRYTFFFPPGDDNLTMLTQQQNLEILFYVITVYQRNVSVEDRIQYDVVRIFIRDNLRGGVFVITSSFPEFAIFNAGILHSTLVSTFIMLD